MSVNNNSVGIFDSGVGGLSIWMKLVEILGSESFIYYADSGNCPYGLKPKEEIIHLSEKNTDFLLEQNCKMIVVACNTATAGAIDHLRAKYKIPFIGIEPAIKPAALNSKTKHIGVLATEGTFNGRLFNETRKKYTSDVEVHIQPGHGLVELVENGKYNSVEAYKLLKKYINPMLKNNVDQIVLGCTHYPFLMPLIQKITKGKVAIIDPAMAVAQRTKSQLELNGLACGKRHKPSYKFYTTGNPATLTTLLDEISHPSADVTGLPA